jgi:hypothetical protein
VTDATAVGVTSATVATRTGEIVSIAMDILTLTVVIVRVVAHQNMTLTPPNAVELNRTERRGTETMTVPVCLPCVVSVATMIAWNALDVALLVITTEGSASSVKRSGRDCT